MPRLHSLEITARFVSNVDASSITSVTLPNLRKFVFVGENDEATQLFLDNLHYPETAAISKQFEDW
jgi:hypothetical protein